MFAPFFGRYSLSLKYFYYENLQIFLFRFCLTTAFGL